MPTFIIKLSKGRKTRYLEWSTISDAPSSYGMTRRAFEIYYRKKYGSDGMLGLQARMRRVEENGCSALDEDLDSMISFNRAGQHGRHLSKSELWGAFCE